jgi:succinate dehydrogenase / fumarate reductase cytochrome b subunit
MSEVAIRRRADPTFLRDRLASLLAVVPLGAWTVVHLWDNLAAFRGPAAWQAEVTDHGHPVAFFATSLVALLPLGLHTVWGLGRLLTTRPNNVQYKYFANLKYALQRLSAIGLLLFLGAHLWLAFLKPRVTLGHPETFADIAHEMHHHLPTLVVYVLGVLGTAYHLANGLHTFAMGWGLVVSRRALRKLDVAAWVTFVVLLAMGLSAVYALFTAGT